MATASGSGTSSDDTGTLTTVPPGVAPGESLSVNMPNGQVLTVSVPGNARPGSIIRVVPSRSVDVMVPHGSKEGDLLRASIGSGNTEEHFVFTVPANIHPGSNMRVMLQAQAQVVEGPQVEARTQSIGESTLLDTCLFSASPLCVADTQTTGLLGRQAASQSRAW
eukprot:1719103-Pleurochrysis_carterae.AAC.2